MSSPTRPTRAVIDLRAIRSNLRFIHSLIGPRVRIMPVVKANAYGHGISEVTRFLGSIGYGQFGVAFPEEGFALRRDGISADIHVFTLATARQALLCVQHGLQPTIGDRSSFEHVRRATASLRRSVDVHIKVETGMNRIGISPQDLPALLRTLGRTPRIRIRGVYTHFATSDKPTSGFVTRQLSRFHDALELLTRAGVSVPLVHAANSGAILHHPESHFDMVRAGIMMYGYAPGGPDDASARVKPALSLVTSIAQVKRIRAGESVSYGRRFVARRPTTIATLPIGYADGLFRTLSQRASVLVGGIRRPIAGRICMDQCMVDCGNVAVKPGQEVAVLGTQGRRSIDAWDQALLAGTIPYEIICAISSRVPREYRR